MPNTLKNILKVLGQLPAAMVFWPFYILPLLLLKQIKPVSRPHPRVIEFELSDDDTWYTRRWSEWSGFSMPFSFIRVSTARIKQRNPNMHYMTIKKRLKEIRAHELEHNEQQRNWGPLFFPAYLVMLILKGYKDNPFEVSARDESGQSR